MAAQRLNEEPPEPLNYKTWVLRVSIHCEGCKKKVKKIISQVPGVYAVDIDIKQQKVTVTGNIEGDAVLKKLLKSGKNAELWPQQQAIHMDKKPAKSNNKEQQRHENEEINTKEINPPVKTEAVQNPDSKKKIDGKKADHGGDEVKESVKNGGAVDNGDDDAPKVVNGGSQKGVADDEKVVNESKSEGKKPVTEPAGGKPPVQAEQKGGEAVDIDDGSEKSVSGRNGKKKKKKGQNGNYSEGEPSNAAPTSIRSQNHNTGPLHIPLPANDGPPRHQMYNDYPPPSPHGPHYYPPPLSLPLPPHGPPPPVYGVSYNTSYPTTSYTASYYAPSPPNSYVYSSYPPPGVQQPPPSNFDPYQNQPLDSFEIFSDENPNGCSVM